MPTYNKNIRRLFAPLLFCLLLLSPAFVFSQYEDSSSVQLADTLPSDPPPPVDEVVEDTVAVEEYGTNDYQNDSYHHYFLNKWEQEGDSFIVQERTVSDSLVRKMKEDDDFWYANSTIKKKEEKEIRTGDPYVPLGQRKWFQTLLWILIIGCFAGFVTWYLADSNVGLFRRRSAELKPGEDSNEIPEDIFAINYQREIDKAVANENFRLAVRLMYLRLLKKLADKNIIQYKQDRTNFDYLIQLQSTNYYQSFFRLTRNYEYSWYGQFDVSREAYELIRNDFGQFENQLR